MKRSKNNGTMWKWFYSYTAALLLPIIFGVILYLFSVRTIIKQAEQLQTQNAEKDYHYLEQTLEGISSNAQNIMLNDDVTYFSKRRSPKQDEAIQVKKTQDVLKGFRLANKAIGDIYVFYPKENLIITDTNCLSMEENTIFRNQMGLYKEPFQNILSENPYNRVFMMKSRNLNYLFYTTCTDSRKSFLEQEQVVMITIEPQLLTEQLTGDDSSALILTAIEGAELRGQEPILLELGSGLLSEKARHYITGETSWEEYSEKEYYIRKKELENYGIMMWNIYSNEETRQEFQRIWLFLMIYIVCCIILGPCMVYWISRRNYKPVEALIQLMESSGLQTGEKDEFAVIHNNLLSLLKGLRDNQKILRRQQDFYEESDLYFLLCTNRVKNRQAENFPAEYMQERTFQEGHFQKKKLIYDGFLVEAFDAEDVKEVLRLEDTAQGESLELLDFVIANVVQEFYADFPARVSGKLGNLYYIILNFPSEEFAEKNYLIWEKTRSICRFLQERFEFDICANISRFKQSLTELPEAYRELQEIAEFRDYIGSEETILCYDTFSSDEEIRSEINYFTQINRLSELLRAHRHKEAEELQAEIRETWHTNEWIEADDGEEELEFQETEAGTVGMVERDFGESRILENSLLENSLLGKSSLGNGFLERSSLERSSSESNSLGNGFLERSSLENSSLEISQLEIGVQEIDLRETRLQGIRAQEIRPQGISSQEIRLQEISSQEIKSQEISPWEAGVQSSSFLKDMEQKREGKELENTIFETSFSEAGSFKAQSESEEILSKQNTLQNKPKEKAIERTTERTEVKDSLQSSKSAEQTIHRIEEYLNQHYLDPQITVSSIAHLFHLNPSYLSRSFCKITGRGMLEYLTALRLEHAKKCMEEGESVNHAAEHSGFYSCRPFIRAFKQEMGVTPGEYYKKRKGVKG